MNRFNELLEKRKNLTADIFEEEELINLSKTMSKEELKGVDKNLLVFSNSNRLDEISSLLDRLIKEINKYENRNDK